jgi:hypothetical protein
MSARATAIAVVALLVLGVALIAQPWRMKDYSLNVSIARERQDDDPEMLRNYQRYFGTGTTPDWVRRGASRSAALCRKANLNRFAARARSSWRSTVRSVMPSRAAVSRWLWPTGRSAETSRLGLPSAPVARPAGAVFGAT